jgi:hypothetical protein
MGWFTGINGNVTARGHTADVDESFIEIAEHADSFAALMGYFEARKGRWGFFTDAVWADLGFPGHLNYDINPGVGGYRAAQRNARSLSNVEAMIGQLYPATLLARLVTLEIEGETKRG